MNISNLTKQAKFNEQGLLTAIAVDIETQKIVMLAHMNKEALGLTLQNKVMTYWSRSRQELWVKGKTSGNTQLVKKIFIDCDGDALIFEVQLQGNKKACHKGYHSCFFRELKEKEWRVIDD